MSPLKKIFVLPAIVVLLALNASFSTAAIVQVYPGGSIQAAINGGIEKSVKREGMFKLTIQDSCGQWGDNMDLDDGFWFKD